MVQPKKKERKRKKNIRTERSDITTDPIDIKRVIRQYYEQAYASKFDKLDEMDKFFEKHKLPNFTQGEIDNLSSRVFIK